MACPTAPTFAERVRQIVGDLVGRAKRGPGPVARRGGSPMNLATAPAAAAASNRGASFRVMVRAATSTLGLRFPTPARLQFPAEHVRLGQHAQDFRACGRSFGQSGRPPCQGDHDIKVSPGGLAIALPRSVCAARNAPSQGGPCKAGRLALHQRGAAARQLDRHRRPYCEGRLCYRPGRRHGQTQTGSDPAAARKHGTAANRLGQACRAGAAVAVATTSASAPSILDSESMGWEMKKLRWLNCHKKITPKGPFHPPR